VITSEYQDGLAIKQKKWLGNDALKWPWVRARYICISESETGGEVGYQRD